MMTNIMEWVETAVFWLLPVAVMLSLGLPVWVMIISRSNKKSSSTYKKYDLLTKSLWATFSSLSLTIFVLLYWLLAYRSMAVSNDWSALADVVPTTAVILAVYALVVMGLHAISLFITIKTTIKTKITKR